MAKKNTMPKINAEQVEHVQEQRRVVADAIISMMERDGLAWARNWGYVRGTTVPCSGRTGEPYMGRNAITLSIVQDMIGSHDGRWYTPYYISKHHDAGWKIKEDATPAYIEKWKSYRFVMPKLDKDGNVVTDNDGKTEFVTHYKYVLVGAWTVYNAADIDGMPDAEHELPALPAPRNNDAAGVYADDMIEACRFTRVVERWGNETPCFIPAMNQVHIPDRRQFKDNLAFLSTLSHEMTHATSLPLERNISGGFGSKDYAYEELIAELGSVFVTMEAGVGMRPEDYTTPDINGYVENHAAYLQSWIKALKNDPDYILRAASKASKAADYIRWYMAGCPEKDSSAEGKSGKAAA